MSERRALALVVGRELREATRRKTFWIVIGVALLASTAAVTLPAVLGDSRTTYDVVVVSGDQALHDELIDTGRVLDADIELTTTSSVDEARRAVDDGKASIAVLGGDRPSIVVKAGENEQIVALAQQVLARRIQAAGLMAAGLSPSQVATAMAQPAVPVDERKADSESRRGSASIISIALYLILLMLTIQVANGTAIEKANRISEVLLAIVRPAPLLFGKVIAVGLVGFLTLAAGVAPVLIKLSVGGDLPAGLPSAIGAGAAWFVLGAALYLTIAGALGALVERQEEAGSAAAPLSIILVGSYLVGLSAPDSSLGAVLAVLPLTSTLVMPSRIAMGVASPASIIASLVLASIAVVLAVRVGAGVYRRAIVRTGRRVKLKDVLRAP